MYSQLFGFMEEEDPVSKRFFFNFGPDVGYWLGQPKR